jgi:hypothetical protein
LNFFANCLGLINTVKVCKKVVSLYSDKLSNVLFKRKNASAALPGSVTIEDFDLRPEPSLHSPALEFKLNNLSYIHSLNKTKQPFYNLLQCFRFKVDL